MAQRHAASLTRAGPARTGVLIHRTHVDCLPLKVSSSSRPEWTCQVGGAEESDPVGSGRSAVRAGESGLTWTETSQVAHPALKQAIKTVEKERQPISDNGIGPRVATFPDLWDRGLEPSKQSDWLKGSQAWSNGEDWPPCTTHWPPDAVQATAGKSFLRQKVTKPEDLSHALQACENLEQRHQERTGDKLPKDMRPAILLAKESTVQKHLFPGFQQVRAHFVTVINSRTRGPAPMAVGNWNSEVGDSDAGSDEVMESEDRQLYCLEIKNRKRILINSQGKGRNKGGGKERRYN